MSTVDSGTLGLVRPFRYGRGWTEPVPIAQPAAAASAELKVPGDYVARVVACAFHLHTDATVANRLVSFEYLEPDGNPYAREGAAVLVLASSEQDFAAHVGRGVAEWNAGTPVYSPLPDVFLHPAHRFRIDLTGAQAGDQLSAIMLLVEKFPTGPRGYAEGRIDFDQ